MKTALLRLMLALTMVPASTLAAPSFDAVHVGDYRPLKAAEAEAAREGFEASWLAGLGKILGENIIVADASAKSDVRFGEGVSGAPYYSSRIAALTAADTGPANWEALAGKLFCVAAGSPHSDFVASHFGGMPRHYPSAAQALIGLKLGECQAVVGDQVLLQQIADLPEWRRYNRLLPSLGESVVTLRVEAADASLQQRIEQTIASQRGKTMLAEITQHWIDEVAFQAYVLADTLDCH